VFVTGTDTGVGKTVLAGAIAAALRRRGLRVAARKPVVTGLDDPRDPDWPPDHELLAAAAGLSPDEVTARTYGPAVSPHLAAELSGRPIDTQALVAAARHAEAGADALVVEGVGGLLVPLAPGYCVRDLAVALGLPLLVAAHPGLGTINHTLLTLEAARRGGLRMAAVVLTPWPRQPGEIERSNRETIARLGETAVATLPPIARAAPDLLADAGETLPLDEWLS
jgi:dethiobiotin synthetase